MGVAEWRVKRAMIGDESLLHTLDNPNAYGTETDDFFGRSVALHEDTAVVGAPYEDDATGTQSGVAYVFNANSGELVHTLINPNAHGDSASDSFGNVAVFGNLIVVGAPNDVGTTYSRGRAYVFNKTTGILVYTLAPTGDYFNPVLGFGTAVSICESYILVGAVCKNANGYYTTGVAYIFSTASGALLFTLPNPNAYGIVGNDWYASSLSICESYAIVGAYGEDDSGGTASGKAYIFNTSDGTLRHTINNPNAHGTGAYDNFARSVSLCESYAIIGAPSESDDYGAQRGKVYIYNPNTGVLLHTINNPNDTYTRETYFGFAVSICETCAAVSAPSISGEGHGWGMVYLYSPETGLLTAQVGAPLLPDFNGNSYMGQTICVSGTKLIAGDHLQDNGPTQYNSGKAYIFSTLSETKSLIRLQ